MKQLEASGNIKSTELKEHVDNVEAAKRRRGSLTGVISDIDASDSESMPNTPHSHGSVFSDGKDARNSRITTEGVLRMVRFRPPARRARGSPADRAPC